MMAIAQGKERVRLASISAQALSVAHMRALVVLLLLAFTVLVMISRLFYIGVFEEHRIAKDTGTLYIPPRADLVDRNGVPLARTIPAFAIRVVPEKIIGDRKELARQLAEIFPDTSADAFLKKLNRETPTYLRRRVVPEVANQVHALGEVGFDFPQENERFYPQHGLGAHLLGYVNADGKGVMGMERVLNHRLVDDARRAEPVRLAMDVRVQAALEHELGNAMLDLQAKGAAGIVLNANTGEVVALASLPEFNPNKIGKGDIARQTNDVTFNVYELGSTFKPLTVAAALDAGTVTNLATRYDATQPLQVGRFKISDDHPQARYLNVPETLVHSSNIVTARLADNLGRDRMEAMLRSLGFDAPPEVELTERGHPLWPQSWGRVTNMTIAYGHGIAVTPMHLASAYAALVNGGIWRPASVRKLNADEVPQGRRVFKAATSARMRQLLRMIVVHGTGRKADAPGFRIGGKTGSAEKPHKGGYKKSSLVSTFAAAFPMDNPKYVVVTMLDEPKGSAASAYQRTAGWTAAPVVGRLVPRIGPMLGVVPDDRRDVDITELTPLLWKARHSG
ncbi:MAG: penicillin-binding protein 2 [Pseudomonadota bacterium]